MNIDISKIHTMANELNIDYIDNIASKKLTDHTFHNNMKSKYNYLFENHETIFKMAMTDKFDSNRLQFMLNMAKKVQLNEITRHDADVEVGTELVNNIVKPQLEKSE